MHKEGWISYIYVYDLENSSYSNIFCAKYLSLNLRNRAKKKWRMNCLTFFSLDFYRPIQGNGNAIHEILRNILNKCWSNNVDRSSFFSQLALKPITIESHYHFENTLECMPYHAIRAFEQFTQIYGYNFNCYNCM